MVFFSRRIVVSLSIAALACHTAVAHHSFYASYLVDKKVTIEGEIVQLDFRNPHSFIQVLVPDSHGHVQRWAVEWAGAGALARTGVAHATLKPGDHVRIVGSPGRNPDDHLLILRSILRPADGWKWDIPYQ